MDNMENTATKRKVMPKCLREKHQMIDTVVFTALVSIVFLLVSIPFSHNAWFKLGNSVFTVFTILFALGGFGIIIVSRIVMYKTRLRFEMTYPQYVLWCASEIIFICMLYTLFTVLIAKPVEYSAFGVFMSSLLYGFISVGVPYILAAMYFIILDQENTIRLTRMSDVVSDEVITSGNMEKITLFDNSGVLRLSVSSSNLYYIESDDNYIIVWYTDNKGDITKYLLRCRMKTVEESFFGSNLVRCHRKFIVNMEKVKVLRREKDGYVLEMDNEAISPIPVTKTYVDNVLKYFTDKKSLVF